MFPVTFLSHWIEENQSDYISGISAVNRTTQIVQAKATKECSVQYEKNIYTRTIHFDNITIAQAGVKGGQQNN